MHRSVSRSLALAVVLPAMVAAQSEYVNVNRALFVTPRSGAMASAAMLYPVAASPNTPEALSAFAPSNVVSLSYAGLYKNSLSNSMAAFAADLGQLGVLNVSLAYLHVPDILDTRDWPEVGGSVNPPPVSEWEYATSSEMYLRAGYGRAWDVGWADVTIGVGLNVLRRRLIDWTGYGAGLDASVAADFVRPGIRVALVGEDITTTYMNWSDTYDELAAPHLRLGVGWSRDIPYIYGDVTVAYRSLDLLGNEGANATDFLSQGDSAETATRLTLRDPEFLLYGNLGLEYTIAKVVSLRAGLIGMRRFTFGAGVAVLKQTLLIDFTYMPHSLGGSYYAGIAYRW